MRLQSVKTGVNEQKKRSACEGKPFIGKVSRVVRDSTRAPCTVRRSGYSVPEDRTVLNQCGTIYIYKLGMKFPSLFRSGGL